MALEEARRGFSAGEVPIGAILVRDGRELARAHNLRETRRDPLAHAETLALSRAARRVGDWRLDGGTIFVTLEPCPMCAGALLQSRIARIVYGAANPRVGAAGSRLNLVDYPGLDHQIPVVSGILEDECQGILEEFFRSLRGRDRGSALL